MTVVIRARGYIGRLRTCSMLVVDLMLAGIVTYRDLVCVSSLSSLLLSVLTRFGVTRLSTTQVVVVTLKWLCTYLVHVSWQQVNVVLLWLSVMCSVPRYVVCVEL